MCKDTSSDDNTRRMFVFPMGKDYQRLYLERRYLRSKCMYIGYEKIMGITSCTHQKYIQRRITFPSLLYYVRHISQKAHIYI